MDAIEMGEFKDYNVIFGNNGCGKTSLTRAFELLISKDKCIEKYRTISTAESPSIEFECKDGSYKIEPNSNIGAPSFKVEIYNSGFLHNNAPFNSEFGLKKLDDGIIILEGSVLGEETKEINQLKNCKEKVEKRKKEIKDENSTETLSAKQESEIKKYDEEIEKIRKKVTSKTIQIILDEIKINNICEVSKNKFKVQEDALTNLEKDFDELDEAMKKFDDLKEMELPKDYQTIKDKLESLFSFDIDKEAGQVSEEIKEHMSKVGREFIEKGIELQKKMPDNACPFCTQEITNNIIQVYTSYFNKRIEQFNQDSLEVSGTLKKILEQWNIKEILQSFERFEPFMKKDFSTNKESLKNALEQIKVLLEKLQKEVGKKEGAKNEKEFQGIDKKLLENYEKFQKCVDETGNILKQKKEQKKKLDKLKTELKEARIKKAKHDSYDWQKSKEEAERKLSVLNCRHERLNRLLEKINKKLKGLYDQKRPDIETINNYLKALNLPKYSLDKDYRIVLNSDALENSEAKIILSDGEKTTLAFAYFLARLKLFYKKEDLKNLVVVIDDPISSLDEQRIYNTTCLVAKINQELAREKLSNEENKAQVFVLTHNHTFMARLINMIGKHARYLQLERHQGQLKIVCKDKANGYFDTFYLLLFKEVYEFAKRETVQDDFNEAINYGNKIRILLESFLKINFIDSFLGEDKTFKEDNIKKLIETADNQVRLSFSNLPFSENEHSIEDKDALTKKFLSIIKGLHLESHGSVMDFFSPYKISLEDVQEFAKIAINAMKILNPYQTHSYVESVDKKLKTRNNMRIVFMGTPGFAEVILRALVGNKDIEVVGLFTQMDKPFGRKKELKAPETKIYILENHLNIPIFQPQSLKEPEVQILKALKPDFIVVVAYGKILSKEVLSIAPCINVHASLLPKYRGASPIHEMILNDDKIYGISTMLMDTGLDSGDILESASFLREDYLDLETLRSKLVHMGATLLLSTLKNFSSITRKPQDHAQASFCKKITKADGLVGFKDAKSLFLKSLAFKSWPEIFLENSLKLLGVELVENEKSHKEGEILEIDEKGVLVGCLKGSVRIARLQAVGKKPLKAKDYLNGKRLKAGGILT
ncbi:hypothetical protein VN0889_13460 [Helicobacter pylori]